METTTTTTTAVPIEQQKYGKELADANRQEREVKRLAKLESQNQQ